MPASRSRTERWRESLWRIYERGGGLEFALNADDARSPAKDLVWRVRILGLTDDEIHIEIPGAMGRAFNIEIGSSLLGIMSVGQNRWMFHTEVIGTLDLNGRSGPVTALRLRMPDRVERCQRRSFDRISSAQLNLPMVECWSLRDIRSAIPAEVASRVRMQDAQDSDITGHVPSGDALLPDVGTTFPARLSNVGGGGVGLIVESEHAGALDAGPMYWLSIDLSPVLPAPLALSAKLAHTHVDSQQRTYAGMAFEFGHNPTHRRFVLDQIEGYLNAQQKRAA